MEWAGSHVYSSLFICWGAMAALYYYYGIPKHTTEAKVSGVYRHHIEQSGFPLTCGFDDYFYAIHSRHAEIRYNDCSGRVNDGKEIELYVLASSSECGPYLLQSHNGRKVFVIGHAEYDSDTLRLEYLRDQNRGINPQPPHNYFPKEDTNKMPQMNWRAHGMLLFTNWINYYVYQATPYRLEEIG